jgi:hypothetical protein
MATKKKTAKKSTKSKKTATSKAKVTKKQAKKKPPSKAGNKKAAPSKSAKNKKAAPRKFAKKTIGKKAVSAKTVKKATIPGQRKAPGRARAPFSRDLRGPDAAGQSGDLQGLSNREAADSESVDELLEEGNAFEAEVLSGVEDADAQEGREVHTHEVPEDDVPEEYLDEK